MGVQSATTIVKCDFPSCTETHTSYRTDELSVVREVVLTYSWVKIDTGGLRYELFCLNHGRWFRNRKFEEVKW